MVYGVETHPLTGENVALREFLYDRVREGGLLAWQDQIAAATCFSLDLSEVELIVLEQGLLPARYQRNRTSISVQGQLQLFRSSVAVIGCGGLGGYIIEQLARIGVGRIVVIDPDLFEEHNLNRQLFSCLANIGQAKVSVARERVSLINPAVSVAAVQAAFGRANGRELLQGVHIVVDALDSRLARLELAELCETLQLPLVHGAIAGWYGQVGTQFPGEKTVQSLYRNGVAETGTGADSGNPACTPAVIASLQVAEVCKIILKEGTLLRSRLLCIDLQEMEFNEVKLQCPP
jgi:molybdopterin/thiamine biosynthesis adenylyltransferase